MCAACIHKTAACDVLHCPFKSTAYTRYVSHVSQQVYLSLAQLSVDCIKRSRQCGADQAIACSQLQSPARSSPFPAKPRTQPAYHPPPPPPPPPPPYVRVYTATYSHTVAALALLLPPPRPSPSIAPMTLRTTTLTALLLRALLLCVQGACVLPILHYDYLVKHVHRSYLPRS